MRHIYPAIAAIAAILATLSCPLPALSQAVSLKLTGYLTDPAACDSVGPCVCRPANAASDSGLHQEADALASIGGIIE